MPPMAVVFVAWGFVVGWLANECRHEFRHRRIDRMVTRIQRSQRRG